MELSLFDQTFPPFKMGVGEATALLLDAMEVPGGQTAGAPTAAPPFITFGWGKLKFKGACTIASRARTSSSPPRARRSAPTSSSASRRTGQPPKGQNPTTRAQAGFGVHRVKDGDTLPSISYASYGDATKWR